MGRAKALLPVPATGLTFVSQAMCTLRSGGVDKVVVIGRPHDAELRHEVARSLSDGTFLENPTPEGGQLSSLLVGIGHAESVGSDAVVVLPVDIPLVQSATVAALVSALTSTARPIIRPRYHGRHGHPVLFAAPVFPELRAADPAVGARPVLRRDPSRVMEVDVDDPAILRDFDLPGDYHRLLAGE